MMGVLGDVPVKLRRSVQRSCVIVHATPIDPPLLFADTYVCICQHKNFNNNITQEQTSLFLQRLLKFVHLSSQD